MFSCSPPEQEKRGGGNESCGGRNRKPREVLGTVRASSLVIGRHAIEASQAQGTARQINESDDPASPRKFLQDHAVNHQSGRDPERNNIRQRIELAAKGAFMTPETGQPSVQ